MTPPCWGVVSSEQPGGRRCSDLEQLRAERDDVAACTVNDGIKLASSRQHGGELRLPAFLLVVDAALCAQLFGLAELLFAAARHVDVCALCRCKQQRHERDTTANARHENVASLRRIAALGDDGPPCRQACQRQRCRLHRAQMRRRFLQLSCLHRHLLSQCAHGVELGAAEDGVAAWALGALGAVLPSCARVENDALAGPAARRRVAACGRDKACAVGEERHSERGARVQVLAQKDVAVVEGCGRNADSDLGRRRRGAGHVDAVERIPDLARLSFDLADGNGGGHGGGCLGWMFWSGARKTLGGSSFISAQVSHARMISKDQND